MKTRLWLLILTIAAGLSLMVSIMIKASASFANDYMTAQMVKIERGDRFS